jgi:hypothetical protein
VNKTGQIDKLRTSDLVEDQTRSKVEIYAWISRHPSATVSSFELIFRAAVPAARWSDIKPYAPFFDDKRDDAAGQRGIRGFRRR